MTEIAVYFVIMNLDKIKAVKEMIFSPVPVFCWLTVGLSVATS